MEQRNPSIRVLLVEDHAADARLVRETLAEVSSARFRVTHVERVGDALTHLRREAFDVALLDLSLPDASGTEIVDTVCTAAPHLPVLVLTGQDDDTLAVRAVQEGAQDYLIKNQLGNSQLLARAIRYAVERKRAEEAQRFLADASGILTDALDSPHLFKALAPATIPRIADWMAWDLLEADGTIRRCTAVRHDEDVAESQCELDRRVENDPDRKGGVLEVLHSGRSQLYSELSEDQVSGLALGPEDLKVLHALSPRSALCVPLVARGRILGGISLCSSSNEVGSSARRRYTIADLTLAEELARRVAMAVDNARLYREAQQAVRSREQVLAFVSHDMKNPLNTITLSLALLDIRELPEKKRTDQLAVIRRSVERMNGLIQDLLDAAKTESGSLTVDPKKHEVAHLVGEALGLHQALAQQKGLSLDSELGPELPPVKADRDRILRVFGNLLGNAVKFTPSEGRVTVSARPTGADVEFAVSDTGPGISPSDLPRLFEPYWQARERSREGTGLGLAITKGIVVAHGGRIWVESRLGHGSTFYFTLPTA